MRYRAAPSFIVLALMSLCATAYADEAVTLRLKWLNQAQFAGFYVAQEKGYYKGEGG
jgi:NitT/TauT family transport system substrate-binding protein